MSLRPIVVAAVLACAAAECPAIEMFTFFGDGSRIGLPSLEVPVEAYPGIPLRSDRIRMRRKAMRAGAPAGRTATTAAPGTITLREVPATAAATPAAEPPIAPEPE